ncbi:leukotriene B4 receptor 1 [Nerophis ophidion]|uniref:leukotriene B4 receptor 1 n=1 Tax=Nerophis ophidion TaxID=159077 RepID=UPI002AE024CC|nr:leukotriene B4 receptor 1 [Nerophis ophidion]
MLIPSMAAMNATYKIHQLVNAPSSPRSFWQSEASRGVQIAATLVIFLVGVPLNVLVVWALGQSRRRLIRRGSDGSGGGGGETRAANSFRIYVLNLALADLVLILRTPLMLGYLAQHNSWPFGSALCRLVVFLRGLGLYASAFLVCAVALERCVCLLRPVWARLRRPAWAVPLACGLLWLLATILSAPYLHSAVLRETNGTFQCSESATFDTGLFVSETVAGFILPMLVFLGSHLAVLLSIKQVGPVSPTSSSSSPWAARRTSRMYRVLFFTMLLFLAGWVPYFVCRLLRALAQGRADRAALYQAASHGTYVSLYLVYAKSALNPVLYVFAARGLGRAVRASVTCAIGRLFNDDAADSIRNRSLKNSQTNKR